MTAINSQLVRLNVGVDRIVDVDAANDNLQLASTIDGIFAATCRQRLMENLNGVVLDLPLRLAVGIQLAGVDNFVADQEVIASR